MRSKVFILGLIVSSLTLSSCDSKKSEKTENNETAVTSDTLQVDKGIDADAMVKKIDAKRSEIETLEVEPVIVLTTNLRGKIKQKWSEIHFYTLGNDIVKIKTYPHKEISQRTEEFYVDNSELILVVTEDDGSGPKGKPKEQLDKMYYFYDDMVIMEIKTGNEGEYNIKNSDSEELISEFREYVDIYNNVEK